MLFTLRMLAVIEERRGCMYGAASLAALIASRRFLYCWARVVAVCEARQSARMPSIITSSGVKASWIAANLSAISRLRIVARPGLRPAPGRLNQLWAQARDRAWPIHQLAADVF